jgi:FHS family L-fucose permease-like MFS transporter
MSIVGEAFIHAAMGRVSDLGSIQTAFALPLICYAYVLYFARRGDRPRRIRQGA